MIFKRKAADGYLITDKGLVSIKREHALRIRMEAEFRKNQTIGKPFVADVDQTKEWRVTLSPWHFCGSQNKTFSSAQGTVRIPWLLSS